jgi:endoglucanase
MASSLFLSSKGAQGRRKLIMSLVLAGFLFCPAALVHGAETAQLTIKVDQVGYPLDGPKVALVSETAATFEVRRSSDNVAVFKGKLTAAKADPDTGDKVQAADFSALKQAGRYYLEIPGVGRSWNFAVGPDVFEHTYYMAMRGFYGQRCGTAVDMGPEFPGYSHPACHMHGEFSPTSGATGIRDNIGGWHDAGDYGRYMVNSGIATGTMLWTWEIFGKKIKSISLNIPETGNGTPDILNEARWNIEWMLKMQDTDGGAWHKQTSEHFSGFIAPEDDKLPSEVIGTGSAPFKSTCATADLAVVGAIAARVYEPYDPLFAKRALEAAQRAWAWTEKYPDVTFHNPPGITTGDYGSDSCQDERLWAAAELARTTGEAQYDDFFLKNYGRFLPSLDSPPGEDWNSVGSMGLWAYALSPRQDVDAKVVKVIRERTVAAAHSVVERTRANPYHVSLKSTDYVWGSNGVTAEYGMCLLIANIFQPDASFVDTARDDLHYLLGRNAFSLSWVTQVGENPYQHPHHRPSGSGKQPGPWPGLLSGGPNWKRQDAVLAALPKDTPPARIYSDQLASYASNEICINWQASLVFLLAGELP